MRIAGMFSWIERLRAKWGLFSWIERSRGKWSLFYWIKRLRAEWGHDKYSAETIDRLIYSKHVQDVRWIVNVTVYAAAFAIILVLIAALYMGFGQGSLHNALLPFTVSAVLAGLGGIVAWCYRTGSSRLGVVDLFACEITTLCRVCTVIGLAESCIGAFELEDREHSLSDQQKQRFSHFESLEAYTPIFDANAKELQALSVKVVINITAFYTYWKATRDTFRRLAKTPATTAVAPSSPPSDDWLEAMRDVLYMQFLAMESARKAVRDLTEFEPNNAENTIMILLSELPLYRSLRKNFRKDDVRYVRLELRRSRYQSEVDRVYRHTLEEHAKYNDPATIQNQLRHLSSDDLEELQRDWDKAYRMLDDLKKCCEQALEVKLPLRDTNACTIKA
jgi:hypothetical protein